MIIIGVINAVSKKMEKKFNDDPNAGGLGSPPVSPKKSVTRAKSTVSLDEIFAELGNQIGQAQQAKIKGSSPFPGQKQTFQPAVPQPPKPYQVKTTAYDRHKQELKQKHKVKVQLEPVKESAKKELRVETVSVFAAEREAIKEAKRKVDLAKKPVLEQHNQGFYFSPDPIVNGIIWSEILKRPKSLRH